MTLSQHRQKTDLFEISKRSTKPETIYVKHQSALRAHDCMMSSPYIALIPAGNIETASSRIRVHHLQKALEELRIRCALGFSIHANVIFIQKRVTRDILSYAKEAKRSAKLVIYDVDDLGDALWYWVARPHFEEMLSLSDHVTTSTAEQKEILKNRYGVMRCTPLPNCIDYFPRKPYRNKPNLTGKLKVIWFGNSRNFRMAEKYIDAIQRMPGVQFIAVLAQPDILKFRPKYERVEFVLWELCGFLPILQTCDLACLMHDGTLEDLAKSNNKMITSINYGVPAIVSRTPEYARTAKELGVHFALFSNADELTTVIEKLRNYEARNSYLEIAQDKCWERYSPSSMALGFLDIVRAASQAAVNSTA